MRLHRESVKSCLCQPPRGSLGTSLQPAVPVSTDKAGKDTGDPKDPRLAETTHNSIHIYIMHTHLRDIVILQALVWSLNH